MQFKDIGNAYAGSVELVMMPQVGREEMAKVIGYRTNAGVPSAVVPNFIGEKLFDTSGLDFYVAFGVSAGNWTPMGINTLTATEIGYLDGATTTQTASKVIVNDTNVNQGIAKVTALHIGVSGSETQVTATAAELNYNDITTLGTVEASKTVTADANKDVTGLRRLTAVNTNASATPGTVRDIYGKQVTGVSLTSGNLVGSRGEVTVTDATNVGAGVFLYGTQGKVITGTGTIDTGSGMVYGTMGQLDVTGATITSGYVAAVGADVFGVSAGTVAVDMFYGQHADGGTIHSYLRAYGKSEVAFDFEGNGGASIVIGAGTYSTADGYLVVKVDGNTYRMPLFSAAD